MNTTSASLAHGEHEEMLRMPKTAPSGSHILQGTPPYAWSGGKAKSGQERPAQATAECWVGGYSQTSDEAAKVASLANYWACGSARLCGIFCKESISDMSGASYAGFLGKILRRLSEEKVWKNIQDIFPGLFQGIFYAKHVKSQFPQKPFFPVFLHLVLTFKYFKNSFPKNK